MKNLQLLFIMGIILLGMAPLAFGLIHPEPGIYIVNTAQEIPPLSGTEVGEDFEMIWGIENRGNVDLDNIFIRGTLDSGVTLVSISGSNCTYDTNTRILECLIPGTVAPFQGIIVHRFVLTADVAGIWTNAAGVCGEYQGTQICDNDQSFMSVDAVPLLIQNINVDALNQIIIDLEFKITQLELRIITLEVTPIDLTPIEDRVTILESTVNVIERWIIAFQTAWNNVF